MTLQQAKQALEQGLRVRHSLFTEDEWIEGFKILNELMCKDEKGYEVRFSELMKWRQDPCWNEGWSIIPKEDNTVPFDLLALDNIPMNPDWSHNW